MSISYFEQQREKDMERHYRTEEKWRFKREKRSRVSLGLQVSLLFSVTATSCHIKYQFLHLIYPVIEQERKRKASLKCLFRF